MSDIVKAGPQPGDEVTVILITPDGEYVTTGTFDNATWNTDVIPIDDPAKAHIEYIKGEQTFTLRLRRVETTVVSPEVARGRRMLKP